MPNGLLSIDGSEVVVWLGDTAYVFNVELSVDVATFAHTAFSVGDSETADVVIKVLESHRQGWGAPSVSWAIAAAPTIAARFCAIWTNGGSNGCRRVPAIPKATEPTKAPSVI